MALERTEDKLKNFVYTDETWGCVHGRLICHRSERIET